jgi:tetratricopeptide (TPR) repeat protein
MVAFHDYPGPSIAIHSPGKVGFELGHFLSAGGDEFAPDVIPREIARAWVPDAQWDSRNAWLTEGLPQYLAWRYLLEVNPEAARILVAAAMHDAGTKVPLLRLADIQGWWARGEKVLARENREREKREARKRGLLVLRTLETVIDRERVDRALPLVMQRSGGKAPSTELFEKVCEEIAGRDLKWFFDYFVADGGIPTIELRRLPSETPGVAAGEIVVKGLPPEGSVRVEMTVRTAQGVVEHSVATRGAVTPFSVNVPAPALGITLDPDQRILRWTEAAERWKTQSAILDELPNPITRKNVPAAIDLYRRALAADPDDASLRAQALHERLGELEWAHDEWDAALADLDAAINGHSLGTYETYLCRGKAYLYHGVVQLHERRPKEALQDALAGMKSPRAVLAQLLPETPIESQRHQTLEHLLDTLINAATHY